MIQLLIVSSVLLVLLISLPNGSTDASPNRVPIYRCQRNTGLRPPPERKPNVFVYVEDQALRNFAKQARFQSPKLANYEITKDEIPCPFGFNGPNQPVMRVTNRDRFNINGANSPQPPFIQTQIPSPPVNNGERYKSSENREEGVSKINKDSIMVQIPINKYFDCKNTEIMIKIGKKEENAAKTTNMQSAAIKEYTAAQQKQFNSQMSCNIGGQDSDLNMNTLRQLYRANMPIRPASERHTDISSQSPRIIELPMDFDTLPSSRSETSNTVASQPQQYVVLQTTDALDGDYNNQQATMATTPQNSTPLETKVNIDKKDQSKHGNSNIPIKDIDIGEFDSYVQQRPEDNLEKCEKCSILDEMKNANASVQAKKNTTRNKPKCIRKNVKHYGIILES